MNILWMILRDEKGIAPWVIPAAVSAGSSILGGLFGKKKKETEVIDPYAKERQQLTGYLGSKLGTSTPYEANKAFDIAQPDIEAQTEQTISGQLGTLPQKRTDIQDIYGKYTGAQKASLEERQAKEQTQLKDMYNRLGLVSSTPGLQASTDLSRQHGLDLAELEAGIAKEGITAEMEAENLYNQIANQWATQGQVLGGTQRGGEEFSKTKSLEDLMRRIAEEETYTNQYLGLIGQPTTIQTSTPNTASYLGQAGQDIGSLMMLSNLLKK